MKEDPMKIPQGARHAVPVITQDKPAEHAGTCPVLNPGYGQKTLTGPEAFELIGKLIHGVSEIYGRIGN